MNIGIYTNSVKPKGAAQATFQSALFEGLARVESGRYKFFVLSHDIPADMEDSEKFTYIPLARDSRFSHSLKAMRSKLCHLVASFCYLIGVGNSRFIQGLRPWINPEPPYYPQLRKLDIRLLWNMNQHALPTCLPFIRTIWDINHRIHSMYPEFSYSRFTFDGLDKDLQSSLAKASYVITGTEEGKRQIVKLFGVYDKKVRVVPFPTPILPNSGTDSHKDPENDSDSPYIFYPARLWPHKNHVTILMALKVLRDKWNINLYCKFCGADEGNLDYLLKFAAQLGVEKQMEYLGEVPIGQLSQLYQNALALVYPSATGPDNLPPLEAMALDCPVIAADIPGAREQFQDSVLFFNPFNENELATCIKDLLKEAHLSKELINKGRKRASSWTVEDYTKELFLIFDEFSKISRSWERNDSAFS